MAQLLQTSSTRGFPVKGQVCDTSSPCLHLEDTLHLALPLTVASASSLHPDVPCPEGQACLPPLGTCQGCGAQIQWILERRQM